MSDWISDVKLSEIMVKKWQPPFLCRNFRHKWNKTVYEVEIDPAGWLKSPLFICKRCGGGKYLALFGTLYFTPESTRRFVEQENRKCAP